MTKVTMQVPFRRLTSAQVPGTILLEFPELEPRNNPHLIEIYAIGNPSSPEHGAGLTSAGSLLLSDGAETGHAYAAGCGARA